MIPLGLILVAAGGSLAYVMRDVHVRSVAGMTGIIVIWVCLTSGYLLLGKGVREWRERRKAARRHWVGRVRGPR
jgi:hypothetical protein